MWETQADAEAFYTGPWRAGIVARYGNDPKVQYFETVALTDKASGKSVIIIGTLGKNDLLDQLVKSKKLNLSGLAGKNEMYYSQVVNNPMPGVESALVIAGSDKRGTIYGIYELSKQMGVSPWYWWADVPVQHKSNVYVLPGRHTDGEPAVHYRGIFINDEGPSFLGWARAKYMGQNTKPSLLNGKVMDNGVNHFLYEHMFELILRLKGNFLWPAMWNNAFNDDDPDNPILADKMGVVMGTSHHEPMTRAQKEWARYNANLPGADSKKWDYSLNGDILKEYWKTGIARNGNKEILTTIGMRGDGDAPDAIHDACAGTSTMRARERRRPSRFPWWRRLP